MGRSKLNFTSLFLNKPNNNGGGGDATPSSSSSSSSTSSSTSSWAWPSCKQAPRTDSFRSGPVPGANMFKTLNSIYLDSADAFSASSDDDIDDTLLSEPYDSSSAEETIIRGLLRSADRLLFEPDGGHTSSSILPAKTNNEGTLQLPSCEEEEDEEDVEVEAAPSFGQESVAMAVESSDPYGDFRRSMEEMVTAHGMMRPRGSCSWDCLEELLVWYMKLNAKKNHGFIVAAFVDLLLNHSLAADSDDRSCNGNGDGMAALIKEDGAVVASSSDSAMSSSVVTSLEIEEEEEEEEERTGSCC